jgi:hypothetical protein
MAAGPRTTRGMCVRIALHGVVAAKPSSDPSHADEVVGSASASYRRVPAGIRAADVAECRCPAGRFSRVVSGVRAGRGPAATPSE